jgi:hypothetical protein
MLENRKARERDATRWAALMKMVGFSGHVFEEGANAAPLDDSLVRMKRDHQVAPTPQEVDAALTLRV